MGKRIDARDVLDPNAKTLKGFRCQIVGYFKRTGPNSWDDYELVIREQGELEVYPKIHVQLEEFGNEFRMRHDGQVLRLRWIPSASDLARIRRASPSEQRAYFIETYLDNYASSPGAGATSVIASKLRGY